MAGWIKMPIGMEVVLGQADLVLDGDPAPPPKKGRGGAPSSIFGPFPLWPNGCMHHDATWYGGMGLSPGDFRTLCYIGTQPRSQKGGGAPQFSSHVYCGQTAGWIKMSLGMEVGLGPSHIVLDGDPAPLPKMGQTPNF